MYRNTFAEINLKNIENNVKLFISKYNNYKYYFGVVKADCYAHDGIKVVKAIINAGCNYLAVATLDEAIEIRRKIADIPILCLGIVNQKYIDICIKNNITITINSIDYLNKLLKHEHRGLKAHLKINTGMNRLGINNKLECNKVVKNIENSNLILEGIYTHIYEPINSLKTNNQFEKFGEITGDINLNNIKVVHLGATDATINCEKKDYANGCRLGIGIYGLMDFKSNEYLSTFSLHSEVIQINEVENESVGYNGGYFSKNKERIAVVSIGYADGIIRKNTGRMVYINNKPYKIVGNICMDMMFVKVDGTVNVGDDVLVIKDISHIYEIAKHLDTITYEVLCSIGKRVSRVYVE